MAAAGEKQRAAPLAGNADDDISIFGSEGIIVHGGAQRTKPECDLFK